MAWTEMQSTSDQEPDKRRIEESNVEGIQKLIINLFISPGNAPDKAMKRRKIINQIVHFFYNITKVMVSFLLLLKIEVLIKKSINKVELHMG